MPRKAMLCFAVLSAVMVVVFLVGPASACSLYVSGGVTLEPNPDYETWPHVSGTDEGSEHHYVYMDYNDDVQSQYFGLLDMTIDLALDDTGPNAESDSESIIFSLARRATWEWCGPPSTAPGADFGVSMSGSGAINTLGSATGYGTSSSSAGCSGLVEGHCEDVDGTGSVQNVGGQAHNENGASLKSETTAKTPEEATFTFGYSTQEGDAESQTFVSTGNYTFSYNPDGWPDASVSAGTSVIVADSKVTANAAVQLTAQGTLNLFHHSLSTGEVDTTGTASCSIGNIVLK